MCPLGPGEQSSPVCGAGPADPDIVECSDEVNKGIQRLNDFIDTQTMTKLDSEKVKATVINNVCHRLLALGVADQASHPEYTAINYR